MKYRDIAKRWIWNNGFRKPMIASDGATYGENKKPFAAGQLDKANIARQSVADSILKRWEDTVPKAERKALPPMAVGAGNGGGGGAEDGIRGNGGGGPGQ